MEHLEQRADALTTELIALIKRADRARSVLSRCAKDKRIPAMQSFKQYFFNELRITREGIREVVVQEIKEVVLKDTIKTVNINEEQVAKKAFALYAGKLQGVTDE